MCRRPATIPTTDPGDEAPAEVDTEPCPGPSTSAEDPDVSFIFCIMPSQYVCVQFLKYIYYINQALYSVLSVFQS